MSGRFPGVGALGLWAVLVLQLGGCGGRFGHAPPDLSERPLTAGFRYSLYGPAYDPGPAYWAEVGQQMAARFEGAAPSAVWIVGRLDGDGTELSFPVADPPHLVKATEEDGNEQALDLFDRLGFRVWLQVEPGHASVEDLIHLVLERYGHHPSVVGFGVDVEWYESTAEPEGKAVTDEVAASWLAAVRSHDPAYRLFLKHWEATKLPPTLRDGLLFIDDSQIVPSLDAMVAEFSEWGRHFAPAPVGFQFGYPSDRPWWRRLDDPPLRIGQAVLDAVPNAEGLYWVDFTVLDVFPDPSTQGLEGGREVGPDSYYDPTPRPIVGVKVYEHDGELEPLFTRWRELGIDTVFAGQELASRPGFRDLARSSGMRLLVIFPVLQAPQELEEEPDLAAVTAAGGPARDDWVRFACPSRDALRQRRAAEAVDLVRRLHPDGLSLDFMRDFVYWEMVGPDHDPADLPDACYCRHCLQRFAAGLADGSSVPVDDPVAAAAWIRAHAAAEWVRFKTETISSYAWQIIQAVKAFDTHVRINLHTVPWRTHDFDEAITRIAGQDRETLGHMADYLSPMCYAFMLHRPPEWISSVVKDTADVGDCPVLPSIQVATAYRKGETFSAQEFEADLRAALEPPSAGVVFWSWEQIAGDPARADVIRRVIAEARDL